MSKILTFSDLFSLAEELHQEGVGKGTGLLPLFRLTCWLDGHMGLPRGKRRSEVRYLISQHSSEFNLDLELTGDAVAFLMLLEKEPVEIEELMGAIEERILARRERPELKRLRVKARVRRGVRPDVLGNVDPEYIVFDLVGEDDERAFSLHLHEFLAWALRGETEVVISD